MKTVLKTIVFLITIIASILIYYYSFSQDVIIGRKNRKNSFYIRKGMNKSQALSIMGKPDRIKYSSIGGKKYFIYIYSAGPIASDNIYLETNNKKVVTNISHGD